VRRLTRYFAPGEAQRFENLVAAHLSKWGDGEVERSLRHLKPRFPEADAWPVSTVGRRDYRTPEGTRVAPALALLRTLV
jgi:hypothetical protein